VFKLELTRTLFFFLIPKKQKTGKMIPGRILHMLIAATERNLRLFFLLFFSISILNSPIANLFAQQPTQQWVSRYQRPTGSNIGSANTLALDKLGNCYVLGNTTLNDTTSAFLTIKYNSTGDTLWTRTYTIGPNFVNDNTAIASDSLGNVYINGEVGPAPGGPFDIITIKYSPTGAQLWAKIYNGAGNTSDYPYDLKLDKQNNIYITGASGGNAVTIKYNPNGDSIWVRKYLQTGYSSTAISIGFDPIGNVFIGGVSHLISQNRNYYMVIKYDSAGNFRWENQYSGNPFDSPHKLTVDRFGNSFLTGEGSDGTVGGILSVKFDSSGVLLWKKAYSYNGTGEYGTGNAVDYAGNLYVTGASHISGANVDYATVKFDANGDSVWARRYDGPGHDDDEAYSIVLDDSSNVFITGRSIGTGTSWDFATIKYNTNGLIQWLVRYNDPVSNAEDVANMIAIDKDQNVYVTGGSHNISHNSSDYTTIKYAQITLVVPISGQVPENFKLYQNYPNPFNPDTRFKFQISKQTETIVKVFDILGRVVATPVYQLLRPGTYQVDFNGMALTSGVYFYKLITNEYTETKKMVLVK
jgi:hypothetical protein